MFSQTLKRIAIVLVVGGGLGLASVGSAEAIEPGVIKVKSISAPAHESMFRAAIADSRQRSELTQHDLQLDWFRALAASSPAAVDRAWISARLNVRSQTNESSRLDTTRDLILRHFSTPGTTEGGRVLDSHNVLDNHNTNAPLFGATAQLTSAH